MILLAALAALALAVAGCSDISGSFDHVLDFDSTSGNVGFTEEHITNKPREQFYVEVTAVGVGDAIDATNVKVEVTLVCKSGPSYSNAFKVELKGNGGTELRGSFERSAPECIDATTGQNGIAVWQIVATRLSPEFNFRVHAVGYLR